MLKVPLKSVGTVQLYSHNVVELVVDMVAVLWLEKISTGGAINVSFEVACIITVSFAVNNWSA